MKAAVKSLHSLNCRIYSGLFENDEGLGSQLAVLHIPMVVRRVVGSRNSGHKLTQ